NQRAAKDPRPGEQPVVAEIRQTLAPLQRNARGRPRQRFCQRQPLPWFANSEAVHL
ncbi:hypothetical protein H4R99_008250, partial [Coemansia sp. RSA 1722]